MVVTSKPITKYCCSDTTHSEARIIAIFSIITTLFCLLVLFITYAQVKGEFFHPSKINIQPTETESQNKSCSNKVTKGRLDLDQLLNASLSFDEHMPYNGTDENEGNISNARELPDNSSNIVGNFTTTIPTESTTVRAPLDTEMYMLRLKTQSILQNSTYFPHNENTSINERADNEETNDNDEVVICAEQNPEADSKKSTERSQLDLMAEFLLWDDETEFRWMFLPFLWNIMDLLRGLVLLLALHLRNAALAKFWWYVTALMCITAIILFTPIVISLTDGEFVTIFILGFVLVLSYNFYGMWIVNTLATDITSVSTSGFYNNGFTPNSVVQIEVTPSSDIFKVT